MNTLQIDCKDKEMYSLSFFLKLFSLRHQTLKAEMHVSILVKFHQLILLKETIRKMPFEREIIPQLRD